MPSVIFAFYPEQVNLFFALAFSTFVLIWILDYNQNYKVLRNPFTNSSPDFQVKTIKSSNKAKKTMIIFNVMSDLKTLCMIATVISIFAVDFHDYPRRFCKTHKLGISLMDVGTGTLMFISGLTSRHFIYKNWSIFSKIWVNIKSMPLLFALAFVGVLTRWLANHPEVVTEYGVHWNFFWTV